MTTGNVIAIGRFVGRVVDAAFCGTGRDMEEERYAAERRRFRPWERIIEFRRWRVDMKTGIFCNWVDSTHQHLVATCKF
jgi:hypothetical protein